MYTSLQVRRLLILLTIWKISRQTPSLLPRNIEVKDNDMADTPFRAFKHGELFHAQADLETYFNIHFTLPQTKSWQEYRVTRKL